jgi:hypothetical protein
MPFLLIDATREKLEAALSAAGLAVLVEGKPLEIADYVSEHRSELSDLAFIFHCKITRSPGGYEIEWPEGLADLAAKPASIAVDGAAMKGGATLVIAIQESPETRGAAGAVPFYVRTN